MGLFGTGRDGRQYDVSFGKGGSAVQAHKAKAERAAKAKATRDARAKAAKASKSRGKW